MPLSFWRGKRVFLTGHTGFKGAWLSLWLQHLGAEVVGYALDPPTTPSLFERASVAAGMRSEIADVRDLGRLAAAVAANRPDVVFHLAAQALVRPSYRDPVGTFSTNVLGTVHLLEAVRLAGGVRAVVVVTSDKCYEHSACDGGCREDDPMGGHDPYSSSKGCAELVTAAYRRAFFSEGSLPPLDVAVASARAGNVIGGGDWADERLVPDCLRAVEAGRVIHIRRPDAVRPWQFVLEPLSGYLGLAERLWTDGRAVAEGWNFGPDPGEARPVSWVADRLVELWGGGAAWTRQGGPHPHEAGLLRLDCSKARTRLGWMPRTDIDLALRWTVEWHRAVAAGRDARAVTLEQIDAFMNREPPRHA
jgi:CDP-glucose 4,6-dehydratase